MPTSNILQVTVHMEDYDAAGTIVHCGKCGRRIYRYRFDGGAWTYKHFKTRVQHEPVRFVWREGE